MAGKRKPEGIRVRRSVIGKGSGGNQDCHRSRVPLLNDMQGTELPLQPLSTCTSSCSPRHWEGPPPGPALFNMGSLAPPCNPSPPGLPKPLWLPPSPLYLVPTMVGTIPEATASYSAFCPLLGRNPHESGHHYPLPSSNCALGQP